MPKIIRRPPQEIDPGEFIEFSVDSALLRELGERLVGKPHVALAELVKNGYDADANNVIIRFGHDQIEIVDDGDGMTMTEFKRYWMRIGTTHKQQKTITKNLGRHVTGSKGVGRLSAQFLGNHLLVESVSRESPNRAISADVNWRAARRVGELTRAGAHVRRLPRKLVDLHDFSHGTRIVIKSLNQTWNSDAVQDLARELWFLRPPKIILGDLPEKQRFDISIEGADDEQSKIFSEQMDKALSNWIASIRGTLKQGHDGGNARVIVKFRDGEEFTANYKIENCRLDQASFNIRVFNLSGKQAGGIAVQDARDYFKQFGGVHIYDDSFRLPFYGGEDQDWLGLEMAHSHRINRSKLLPDSLQVTKGLNDLPTNGRIFGAVKVSTSHERDTAPQHLRDHGDYLNIQVTRDRLIDNQAFENLVHFVRWALDFYATRSFIRRQRKKHEKSHEESKAESTLDEIRDSLFSIQQSVPASVAQKISHISHRLEEFEDIEEKRKQVLADERILLGALATAGMGAVALEHELGKEITALREVLDQLQKKRGKASLSELELIEHSIEGWIERSSGSRQLFSPLMHQADRERRGRYSAKKVISRIAKNSALLIRDVEVSTDDIPDTLKLPIGTFAGWNAVVQNVLLNAVNAMIQSNKKRIWCHGHFDTNHNEGILLIEDTGAGVDLEDAESLFKPFVRKLEIPKEREALGLGGVGLGLTIVRMVSESLGCSASFTKPSSHMKTAFRLSWKLDHE